MHTYGDGCGYYSDKKIKQTEFYASAYLHIAMILWGVYFGIQILTVALLFRNWNLLAIYGVSVIALGLYCLLFYPVRKKIFGSWRLLRIVRKQREVVENLVSERAEIILLMKEARDYFKE